MAQEYFKINNVVIPLPDAGVGYNFETTYTEDSGRTIDGVAHTATMFTVEALTLTWATLTLSQTSSLLQAVAKGDQFTFHYPSPYYGTWRDDSFYVGQGGLTMGRLNESQESMDGFSIQFTGVNPI